MAPRISVVVNARDEELNLPYALRSVQPWADEIVVVDMESRDRTAEIARSFGAHVIDHPRTEIVDAARAFAVSQATGDWVLLLDADEVVQRPLSVTLREIASDDGADVVVIPWVNYLLGARMGYTGWGPHQDRHPRFFKPSAMRIGEDIHGFLRPVPDARLLELEYRDGLGILHFNYLDFTQFLEKLNRYTTVEAVQSFERGERFSAGSMISRATRAFLGRYVRHGGYRDGWRGLCLSMLMAAYRVAVYGKLAELEHVGPREQVRASYVEAAERALSQYAAGESPTRAPDRSIQAPANDDGIG